MCPSTCNAEVGWWIKVSLQDCEFKASLGYIVRPHLKKPQGTNQETQQRFQVLCPENCFIFPPWMYSEGLKKPTLVLVSGPQVEGSLGKQAWLKYHPSGWTQFPVIFLLLSDWLHSSYLPEVQREALKSIRTILHSACCAFGGLFSFLSFFFHRALFQYWNRVLLFSLGFTLWPGTYCEVHVGLKVMEIPLPQSHKYWDYWCYCITFHPNLKIILLHRSRTNRNNGCTSQFVWPKSCASDVF